MGEGLTVEDRLALRALVDAYADAVDRKEAAEVAALFAPDGRMVVAGDGGARGGGTRRRGRREIADALAALGSYHTLTHVVGGQALARHATDGAVTGITTCVAHHVLERGDRRVLQVMGVKYHDTYVRLDEGWRFAERTLEFQWRDERDLPPARSEEPRSEER